MTNPEKTQMKHPNEELRERQIQAVEALINRAGQMAQFVEQILDEANEIHRLRSIEEEELDGYKWSLVRRSEQRLRNHVKELAIQSIGACIDYQEKIYHLTPISLVQQVITRLIRSIARDREIPF